MCMNLKPIIQSEVTQKEKEKYQNAYICNLEKSTDRFIYRAAVEKQTLRIDIWTWEEGKRGWDIWSKEYIWRYI